MSLAVQSASDRSDRNDWSDVWPSFYLPLVPKAPGGLEKSDRSRFQIGSIDSFRWSLTAHDITSPSGKTHRRSRREALGRSRALSYLKEHEMTVDTGRRNALLGFSSVALGVAALAAAPAHAETDS